MDDMYKKMRLCFLGAYDPSYPRNTVLKKGLRESSVEVRECRLPKYKFWLRYPLFFFCYPGQVRRGDFIFVPEFCQKDVPLAKFLSFFGRNKIVFDPLASRFETKITDWRRKPENSPQAWWNYKIDLWAFKFSDLILADTQTHKNYYCQKYGVCAEKVAVLPVGYDDDVFLPPSALVTKGNKDRFVVLFFGSFLPLHGVDVVVEAANIIRKEDPSVCFQLIGSGQTLPKIKSLASELGLDTIEFESWLPQSLLIQKIALADICLGIFGKTEKARRVVPHKIFQAMGMKKPVITAPTPAVEEFFSHRENIFLCEEPGPESLARAILELKKDASLKDKIAREGYELVREKYSSAALGRRFKKILLEYFGGTSRREIA
jgi:glycosyltransferase involved in cell wall biosynthesis